MLSRNTQRPWRTATLLLEDFMDCTEGGVIHDTLHTHTRAMTVAGATREGRVVGVAIAAVMMERTVLMDMRGMTDVVDVLEEDSAYHSVHAHAI